MKGIIRLATSVTVLALVFLAVPKAAATGSPYVTSPLYEVRLEQAQQQFAAFPNYSTGLSNQNTPVHPEVVGSLNPWSACAGSVCLLSGCVGSVCFGSTCVGSACSASNCAGSGCAGSVCGGSGCAGSICGGSACVGTVCAGSACSGGDC